MDSLSSLQVAGCRDHMKRRYSCLASELLGLEDTPMVMRHPSKFSIPGILQGYPFVPISLPIAS